MLVQAKQQCLPALLADTLLAEGPSAGHLRSDAGPACPLLWGPHPVVPVGPGPFRGQLLPQLATHHPAQAREEISAVQQAAAIFHIHQLCLAYRGGRGEQRHGSGREVCTHPNTVCMYTVQLWTNVVT